VHRDCSALAQTGVQAVQFRTQSLGEEVMGAGATAKWGRGPRGRHSDHHGVIGGHDEVLARVRFG
jgi:hypothetical protein